MPELIEGFAVETRDALIFTVKGLLHPPERVIAYLRYLPEPAGERARDDVRYRRVYYFEEQEALLRTRYPIYLADDPVLGLRLQSVPRRRIRTVYDPRRYLAALRERGPDDSPELDPLEEDALALTTLLQETADIPWADLGVSGSLMLGLHRPDSDLDLIVYGEATGRNVYQTLRDLLDETGTPLSRPNRLELAALHSEHRPDTPLPFDDFARLQRRKVNELRFRGRETFVRFVKYPGEIKERYGDRRFEPLGAATVRARVTDDHDAIFTPCRYIVEAAALLDSDSVADLREIVSFRGRFSDQARSGERIEARGSLERVEPRDGPAYHRLVVGGRAGDYLGWFPSL